MGRQGETHWLISSLLVLLLLVYSSVAAPANRSALSRWLGDVVTPELREMLAQHPRYRGQPLELMHVDANGLSEAIVTVLTINLRGREGISLHTAAAQPLLSSASPARIDDLQCASPASTRLHLAVSAVATDSRQGQVHIALVEPGAASGAAHSWEWRGSLSRAELKTLEKSPAVPIADGSPVAPWTSADVEQAAQDMQRQLACALRPQLATRLDLEWFEASDLHPVLADTLHRSRHLLGSYAELGFTRTSADYRLAAEVTPFSEDISQLWLKGLPQSSGLAPVQAVAYFRHLPTVAVPRVAPYRQPVSVAPAPAPQRGPALDYLGVELLDASLGRERAGSADLQVRLRLENRSEWPIDYAFSLSGGHYQHCISEPARYRHDRYGRLAGRLEPGQSIVRPLVVKGAEHRPNPWLGPRKCAGFRSLEGFERYSASGDSVTEYVRWGL